MIERLSAEQQRQRLETLSTGVAPFDARLRATGHTLRTTQPRILQINVGKLCNMSCAHCHVDAGPHRTDAMMSDAVVDDCIRLMDHLPTTTLDLTGGAPELHPRFRDLVTAARQRGLHVMDRCNLTVLLLPRMAGLVPFLADHGVELVASLPHYRARHTDAQRGEGTFDRSLRAIRLLNEAGYGHGHPDRRLTLISNPAGAWLAGDQAELEALWRHRLERDFDLRFDRLLLMNNMPISRFLEALVARDALDRYMHKLVGAFNPATVPALMCRDTLSIGWEGRVFDCDFNQMLEMDAHNQDGRPLTVRDLLTEGAGVRQIRTGAHCFGCTAGRGSGCGGQG